MIKQTRKDTYKYLHVVRSKCSCYWKAKVALSTTSSTLIRHTVNSSSREEIATYWITSVAIFPITVQFFNNSNQPTSYHSVFDAPYNHN